MSPRSSRRKTKWLNWQNIVLTLAAIVTTAAVYVLSSIGLAVNEIHSPPPAQVAPEVSPAPVKTGERINILIMGLDDDNLRSDTLLLASVDIEAKKVGVIQIPRDTRARLAGKGTIEKINAAYAYGVGDKAFPANLRALKTVEDLLDIRIHYTVVVQLEGFRKVIDEVGGVTIDVPRQMDYDDPVQNLHIHFQPGRQKLNGKQALEFVRWRHNNDGTGYPDEDLGRIRTQQQFLRTLLDQALKVTNLPFLPSQMVTLSKHVESTIEPARMLSLAKLGALIDKANVEFTTLPGIDSYVYEPVEKRQISYYVHDPTQTKQLVDRLVRGIK